MSLKKVWGLLFTILLFSSCVKDDIYIGNKEKGLVTFRLYNSNYENSVSSRSDSFSDKYDKVVHYIASEDGSIASGIKSFYDSESGRIIAEGLHSGNYKLLVLAIKGDYSEDNVTINNISNTNDIWVSFPEKFEKPLNAEYFHSVTPFKVEKKYTNNGEEEIIEMSEDVEVKRFVGRVDCQFLYENNYIRTSVIDEKILLENMTFFNNLSGDGTLSGKTEVSEMKLDLKDTKSFLILPTNSESGFCGNIEMLFRRYNGSDMKQDFLVNEVSVSPNMISVIKTKVSHPDENLGIMFFTDMAYKETRHSLMFQDDEPVSVYTNRNIRAFTVDEPLQIRYNSEIDSLTVKFFLPKPLLKVSLKAKIPGVCDEYFDLAYFDSIPGLAEMYCRSFLRTRKFFYNTESGKKVEIGPLTKDQMANIEFKIESDTEYWKKLKTITHRWLIGFDSYNCDPILGTTSGAWKAPRPVHCREYLIAFINMAYMFNMDEYWDMIAKHNDEFLNNAGKKIDFDDLKRRHLKPYQFYIGLANGVEGVAGTRWEGGPSNYGVAQHILQKHYPTDPHTLFHEFGHIMGYQHESTMSYGKWAEDYCKNFYLKHFKEFPIESRSYNDYDGNPNLYK